MTVLGEWASQDVAERIAEMFVAEECLLLFTIFFMSRRESSSVCVFQMVMETRPP